MVSLAPSFRSASLLLVTDDGMLTPTWYPPNTAVTHHLAAYVITNPSIVLCRLGITGSLALSFRSAGSARPNPQTEAPV